MKKLALSLGLATGAAGLVLSTAGVAAADPAPPRAAGCTVSNYDAAGDIVIYNWDSPGNKVKMIMTVTDVNESDGHHTRARVVSKNVNGTKKYWPWHANYSGGSTKRFDLTAYDDEGLFEIGVQVATFEKDSMLTSCGDWA